MVREMSRTVKTDGSARDLEKQAFGELERLVTQTLWM